MATDEILDPRADLFAPATTVKHAVMSNTLLNVMHAHIIGQIGAKLVGCACLTHAGDIVAFAFDRQKGGLGDGRWFNRNPLPAHRPFGQLMFVEHGFQRLKIELGTHIHDGQIFVIEIALGIGTFAVPLDKMGEHLVMGGNVLVPVHAHETGKLHEARINAAHHPGMGQRHMRNDMAFKPVEAVLLGKVVDLGRVFTGIDRAAHKGHRCRLAGLVPGGHQRCGRNHRNRWLTHRHQVGVRAKLAQELHDIVDIAIKVEMTLMHRNHAGIDPVGDVNIVIGQ